MNRRRIGLAAAALALVAIGSNHPTANIQVLTHEAADLQPRRFQAAIDLGVVGFRLLYTWSSRQLR